MTPASNTGSSTVAAHSIDAGHGSHDAWLLAQSLPEAPGPTVIVCAQAQDGVRLLQELAWFAPGLRLRLLPDWAPRPGIVHAVFASRRGLLPSVRGLIDFLAERFARATED